MHEISLVRSILGTLEQEFPDRVSQIRHIQLKAGILSNVQPILMQNAFEAVLVEEKKFQNATLQVEVLPIIVHCDTCHTDSEVENYKFICKQCQQATRNIIQGEELLIAQVGFES